MSQRYFLTTESTYEALRLAVDADLGYPTATADSIFTPALQAPRDSLRRIVLAVDDALPGYSQILARVTPLLANSSAQELTETEYLAFLTCVSTSLPATVVQRVGSTNQVTVGPITSLYPIAPEDVTEISVLSIAVWDGNAYETVFEVRGDGLLTFGAIDFQNVINAPATYAPSAHKASHATGGTDALSPADIGAAAVSHQHGAADITSGTVDAARLGSGTASSSTFLRGDQTWASAGSTSASDLTSGTLADARLSVNAQAAINLYLWSSFR